MSENISLSSVLADPTNWAVAKGVSDGTNPHRCRHSSAVGSDAMRYGETMNP